MAKTKTSTTTASLRLQQAKKKQASSGGSNGKRNGSKKNGNGNGNGSTAMSAPMSIATTLSRPLNLSVTRMSGSDYITTVSLKANATRTERILISLPVSPSSYPGTRITQLSNLWERYRLNSFRLRYVPAIPTSIACQLLLYIDTDPLDDPLESNDIDVILRQATAQTGSVQWNAFTPRVCELANRADDQMYYTGEDKQNERFSLQGKAFLVQVTDPINFVGDSITDDILCGALYLDWDVSFQIPQINPVAFSPPIVVSVARVDDFFADGERRSATITNLVPYGRYSVVVRPSPGSNPSVSGSTQIKCWIPNGRNDASTTNTVLVQSSSSSSILYLIPTQNFGYMTAVADGDGLIEVYYNTGGSSVSASGWALEFQAIPIDGTPLTAIVDSRKLALKEGVPVVAPLPKGKIPDVLTKALHANAKAIQPMDCSY